jgi:hypothetical protein
MKKAWQIARLFSINSQHPQDVLPLRFAKGTFYGTSHPGQAVVDGFPFQQFPPDAILRLNQHPEWLTGDAQWL